MKRIFIAVSVVLMLISLLVGCNDGNNKNVYEQITPAEAKALMDSDGHSGHTEDGMIFSVEFEKWSNGETKIKNLDILPLWVNLKTVSGKRVYENGELIFYYDGDYAENYDCENEECEYSLTDTLFPIKESGFVEAVGNVERNDGVVRGNLYFREYINNRIFQMTDGAFVATEDYAKKFADFQTLNLANAA